MLEPIAEHAALAWPLALTLASVAVADRVRARRRRERLNRALHELRRPLQALTLSARRRSSGAGAGRGQLELALDALADLDRAVNGGSRSGERRIADAGELARDAVGRWRAAATLAGRRIELRWRAEGSRVACDPTAIARALDNLIANALEHGRGPVRVEGVLRTGRVRLLVSDGVHAGASDSPPRAVGPPLRRGGVGLPRRADPRRGHGLRVVADVAADHGGRFAACRHDAGACAVIELPLADCDP
jgi:signal transduction histidine kinase